MIALFVVLLFLPQDRLRGTTVLRTASATACRASAAR